MNWKDILKSFSPSPQYLYQHVYNELFNLAYEKLEEEVEERIRAKYKGRGGRDYAPNPNSEVIEQNVETLLEDMGLGPESLNDTFETYQKRFKKGNELISLDRKKDFKDLTDEENKTLDDFIDYQINRIR
tara:strand:+ start:85 stop:474 length:390 start_codon:yes stop_codon:yes gene_type:complete